MAPNLETHCKLSSKRIGKEYRGMHKWMDNSHVELGSDHRRERHDSSYIPFIERKWGKIGVLEFLYHIEVDNRSTREKLEQRYSKDKRLHILNCRFCGRKVKEKFTNCGSCDKKVKKVKQEFLKTYEAAIGKSKFKIYRKDIEDYAQVYAEEKLKEQMRRLKNKEEKDTFKRIYYRRRW